MNAIQHPYSGSCIKLKPQFLQLLTQTGQIETYAARVPFIALHSEDYVDFEDAALTCHPRSSTGDMLLAWEKNGHGIHTPPLSS